MIYYADIQRESGKVTFVFPAETVGKDFSIKKTAQGGNPNAAEENNLSIFYQKERKSQ